MKDVIEQLKTSNLLENNNEFLYSLLEDEKLQIISENVPSFYAYGKNLDSIAYISWKFNFSYEKENDFDIMSNAYFECALELINKCIEDNKDKKINEQFILSLEIAEHFLKDLLSKSEDVTFIRYPVDKKITNSSITIVKKM